MLKSEEKIINSLFMTPYVKGGRTSSGFDCWGLIVILYKELFHIHIPEYEDIKLTSMSNSSHTSDQMREQIQSFFPFSQVIEPKFGDIIMFNVRGNPLHIGFALDQTNMIHTSSSTGVVMENYRGIKWQTRLAGFWRHKHFEY